MANNLAQLTDSYEQPAIEELPVENPYRRIPVYKSDGIKTEDKPEGVQEDKPSKTSVMVDQILNKLFRDDDKRYQLWPEKVARSALTAVPDAYSGKIPMHDIDPITGEARPSQAMIERSMDMASFAGTGGLGGATDATLGATPFLRPALKYKDKLYKGKEGQQHMDVIPEALYPEFQKMAMSGEDISHYNFGFYNDKGHFLDREKALKYGIDTGIIDPQAGKFGALTSTLMADSSKPGMAIEAMGKANPFFSAVEHNLNAIPQTKMTGDQWLGTLSNKPGVKPEELDWTGLKSFLEENKGKVVSKETIQEHLAANKIELKEVSKGAISPEDYAKKQFEKNSTSETTKWENLTDADRKAYTEIVNRHPTIEPTKYHSYQLPGGENYREMLLTLPREAKKIPFEEWYKQTHIQDFDKLNPPAQALERAKYEREGQNVLNPDVYRSSHWDEPNILAHVRMNDRTIDGKKSLHLEEIQSDWHQQGRDKGYKLSEKERARSDEIIAQGDKIGGVQNLPQVIQDEAKQLATRLSNSTVPDAPFKKSWHELALKRMIREAAEKGYDRLSWTPGEAQAARYDLSKSVDVISVSGPDKNGKYLTYIEGKDKQPLFRNQNGFSDYGQKVMTGEELTNTVGKDVAKKLMEEAPKYKNNEKTNGFYDLKGDNLKIGGEGMKGFYDKMIPQYLEKLGKEHGVKVKQAKLKPNSQDTEFAVLDGSGKELQRFPNEREANQFISEASRTREIKEVPKRGNDVHYIDIPQSLKDQAIGKGFPLFSKGFMFSPVDYEPEFK